MTINNRDLALVEERMQRIILEIRNAIEHMDYGEIVITVHGSKVVQVEKREKKRFT